MRKQLKTSHLDFLSSTSVRKRMKRNGKGGNQRDRLAQRRGGAERFFALLRIRNLLFLRAPSRVGTRSDVRFSKSYECLASRHLPVQMGCKPMKVRGLGTRRFRVCVATRLDAAAILRGKEERGMANFLEYNPEQAYLLPPTVRAVLGEDHLCFFVHGTVEKLDLRELEASYSDEGHPAYHPALLLKVWLYAYALGVTSSRRLEQRIREDLAFRYLAGGAQPDFWALNEFRKRHGREIGRA